jgi:hypothetical protein
VSKHNERIGRHGLINDSGEYVRFGIKFVDFDVVRLDGLDRSIPRDEADVGILVVLRHGVTDGATRLGI